MLARNYFGFFIVLLAINFVLVALFISSRGGRFDLSQEFPVALDDETFIESSSIQAYYRQFEGSNNCTCFASTSIHQGAGLGHRLTNIAQGLVVALQLNTCFAVPPIQQPNRKSQHGAYFDMDNFFGFGVEDKITKWLVDMEKEKGTVVAGNPPSRVVEINQTTFPSLFEEYNRWDCRNILHIPEFWIYDFGRASAQYMRAKVYNSIMKQFPNFLDIHPLTIYDSVMRNKNCSVDQLRNSALRVHDEKTSISIAIHYRHGDIQPTPIDHSMWLLNHLISTTLFTRYYVFVSLENKNDAVNFVHKINEMRPNNGATISYYFLYTEDDMPCHKMNMMLFWTVDILIASGSSYSITAGRLSWKPLVFLAVSKDWPQWTSCTETDEHICLDPNGYFLSKEQTNYLFDKWVGKMMKKKRLLQIKLGSLFVEK